MLFLLKRDIRLIYPLLFTALFWSCSGDDKTKNDGNSEPPVDGLVYYFDAEEGHDDSDGTSESQAWRNLDKISSTLFGEPVTVRLKRGGTWRQSLILNQSDITVEAYGEGELPVIDGGETVDNWTALGGGLYSHTPVLDEGEMLGHITMDGDVMTFLAWNTDVDITFNGTAAGSFSIDFNQNSIYIKTDTPPDNHVFRASTKPFGVSAEGVGNIAVRQLHIKNTSFHGIHFSDCDTCTVENVTIEQIGGTRIANASAPPPDFLYAGNGIEFNNNSVDGGTTDAVVTDVFDSCLTVQTFANNQTAQNIQFNGGDLQRCGFAGIEISVLSAGGTTGSAIDNITVTDQIISESGKGWSGQRYGEDGYGIRVIADAGAGTMSGVHFENVNVTNGITDGVRFGGNIGEINLTRSLIANNNGYGITIAEAVETDLFAVVNSSIIHNNGNFGLIVNAGAVAGAEIIHNTFYNNSVVNLGILDAPGQMRIVNNLFAYDTAMAHLFLPAQLNITELDYNCYQSTDAMIGIPDAMPYSLLDTFTQDTGYEANGVQSSVENPMGLSNPNNGDFRLSTDSLCQTQPGSTGTGISTDFDGDAFTSPPSRGAQQF